MAESLQRSSNTLETLQSYNYSIVLRAFDTDLESKFGDTMTLTEEVLASKTRVLAATGGTAQFKNRYGQPDQPGDAFIKSLTMTNTNGLNGGGQGRISPVTEMRLDIVETQGANFISSLMAGTAIANLKTKSDEIVLKQQAPFLLSITFQASTEDGSNAAEALKDTTKHIKIQVTKCNFSVKATGITYELLCTPYSHMALTDTLQSAAYNSAYSLTGLTMDEFVTQMKTIFNKREKENNTDSKNNTTQMISYDFKYVGEYANKLFKTATLNAISGENSDTNLDSLPMANANSYIPDPDRQESSEPTADSKNQERSQGDQSKTNNAAAGGARTINIPKGTSVHQVLERLAMNSTMVGEYFKDPKKLPSHVPFIRVFPIIESKSNMDKEKNITEKVIVFNIVGVEIPVPRAMDVRNPDRVKEALDKIKTQTFRVYNYLWTGGNQSILNLDIRYDNLYTQAYNIWHKVVENSNPNADRATLNGEAPSAAAAPTVNNGANTSTPENSGKQNNPTVPVRAGDSGASAGMLKDYNGVADKIRTLLPDIFNDQVEKSIYRANIEVIGDPDFISEVDTVRTQGHLEKLVKEYEEANGRSFSVTTAGSTDGATTDAEKSTGAKVENNTASAPESSNPNEIVVIGRKIKRAFTPFEPYYVQVHIGNKAGKQFGGTEFGGYYLPIKFTHNFGENGKFTTLIDAVKVQGLDLKSTESDPAPGTKDVVTTPALTVTNGAIGSSTALAAGSTNGGLNQAVNNASTIVTPNLSIVKSPDPGSIRVTGVVTAVQGAPTSGAPGNSPPAQLVTGAASIGVSVKLPSTVDAPTTAAAAQASAEKNLGGSIDKNPGEDASAPPKSNLFDAIKQTNQLNSEMQKLANTSGDAVAKMGGELNTMMAGMADKAGTALKNSFGGAAGDLKGKATGMLGNAASKLKDASGGLTKAAGSITGSLNKGIAGIVGPGAAAGGGATASPSGGLSAGVTDVMSTGANIGAGMAKSAAEQLSTKIASFQIPGMPLMAGPTKEDLTNKLKSMSKIDSPPIDPATGQLKLPDVKAAADAAAGLADKAGAALGGAVDKLTSKLPSAEKVSGAVDKLTGEVAGKAAGAAAAAEKAIAAPFSAAQIKENSTKLGAAIKDITKDVMGKVPAINPAAALKEASGALDKAVSGVGLPSLGATPSLGGGITKALTSAQSKLSDGLKSVTGAVTGSGGSSSLINNAANGLKGVDPSVLSSAGSKAMSGITAAASKGLGGTSLSDAITAKASAAMGPMSGVNNPVSTLADKVKNFKLPEIELPKVNLGGAVGASVAKVEGELAKISIKEVQSASGAGNLSIAEQTAAAEKLAVSSLATANALPNAIPGSVKIVGLNDVIPKFELNQKTGAWSVPTPKLAMPSLSGLPSVSTASLPSLPNLPSIPTPRIG
jgi:hypothetical protein